MDVVAGSLFGGESLPELIGVGLDCHRVGHVASDGVSEGAAGEVVRHYIIAVDQFIKEGNVQGVDLGRGRARRQSQKLIRRHLLAE